MLNTVRILLSIGVFTCCVFAVANEKECRQKKGPYSVTFDDSIDHATVRKEKKALDFGDLVFKEETPNGEFEYAGESFQKAAYRVVYNPKTREAKLYSVGYDSKLLATLDCNFSR